MLCKVPLGTQILHIFSSRQINFRSLHVFRVYERDILGELKLKYLAKIALPKSVAN